jgi:uncharacterized protein YqeY
MSLSDVINEQIKTAMKAGDKVRLETLRSLRAGILEFEKSGTGRSKTQLSSTKLWVARTPQQRSAQSLRSFKSFCLSK